MSRVFGIDIRDNHVRVVSLRSGYRKLEFDGFAEELLANHESKAEALRACLSQLPVGTADVIVSSVNGALSFSHLIFLPISAKKRLTELLPFELEAVLPVEPDKLVVDYLQLDQYPKTPGQELAVLACAVPIERVRQELELVRAGCDHQPERVGVSSAELAQLCQVIPALNGPLPVAVIDFGYSTIDVCVLRSSEPVMLRTLSGGVSGFPGSAEQSLSALRQTLSAFAAATGQEVRTIYVAGEGALMSGLGEFLSSRLDVEVLPLPAVTLLGLAPQDQERVALFGRALGTALHGVRGRGLDLRKGPLAFERGYQNLKARAPLSAALLSVVVVSFLFSVWAESRALAAEHEALLDSLELVTKSTFGQASVDPDEAEAELEKARKIKAEDPMPYVDGWGVMVGLAEMLPADLKHDIEEFDFDQGGELAKSKLKIRGQVDSADDAQKVAQLFTDHRCIDDAKISKITQVVNSERERYSLEAEVRCPEDPSPPAGKKKSGAQP